MSAQIAHRPHGEQVCTGVFLILLATLCIVLMNACAKVSSVAHGPVEMVFYRGVVALGLLVPYMLATHPVSVFKTRRIGAHLYRAAVGNVGVGLVFWAYSLLPMANATALLFAAPLFVAALSPLLLKERVDGGRWMAVAAGFGGILTIARPSVNLLADPASMVGVGAALCIALVDMALRNLGRTESPLTTVFYFILGGVILSAPYTLLYGIDCTYDGEVVLTRETTAIVWASLVGWLLWKEVPAVPVMAGTIVVVASNLYACTGIPYSAFRDRCCFSI
jgi:drug/metabolite transporter (DMT)-like permease